MSYGNPMKTLRVTERGTCKPIEIPVSEISMLGMFEEEKPLNDFLTDGTVKYGCWQIQLKDGRNLKICGEITEYDKAVAYLIKAKGDTYDETRKRR